MNLGADFLVFVNEVAFFERDVFDCDAKADHFVRVEVQRLSGIGGGGVHFGFFGGGRVGGAVSGELVENVAKVELVTLLGNARV